MFSGGVRCPFPGPTARPEAPGRSKPPPASSNRAEPPSETKATSSRASRIPPDLRTSVMLNNVPTNYSKEMLMGLFDNHGFAGRYDFVHLPLDFVTHENKGYAHVNLSDSIAAAEFWDCFQGFSRWWRAWCKERCELSWSPEQGYDAHIERYRNSPLMHQSVPDQFRPTIFSNG